MNSAPSGVPITSSTTAAGGCAKAAPAPRGMAISAAKGATMAAAEVTFMDAQPHIPSVEVTFVAAAAQTGAMTRRAVQGDTAVLFCFIYLYVAFAGGGAWSVDRILLKRD